MHVYISNNKYRLPSFSDPYLVLKSVHSITCDLQLFCNPFSIGFELLYNTVYIRFRPPVNSAH